MNLNHKKTDSDTSQTSSSIDSDQDSNRQSQIIVQKILSSNQIIKPPTLVINKTNKRKIDDTSKKVTPKRPKRITKLPAKFNDFIMTVSASSSITNTPKNYKEAINSENAEDWKLAMENEYASILSNDTWELVNPH